MPGKDFATNEIMPLWWNWQTRGTQNPVVAIPCRFDPDQRHHRKDGQGFILVRLFCGAAVNGDDAAKRKLIVIKKRKNCRRSSICLGKFLPRVHAESGKRQSPTKSLNEQDKSLSVFSVVPLFIIKPLNYLLQIIKGFVVL